MKFRFLALLALVLGLASCQNDFEAGNIVAGGEVDFQLSVDANELATRAGQDGNDTLNGWNSAYGAIDYLKAEADALRYDWTDVDLRYSLEVYDVTEDADGNKVVTNLVPVKDRQVIIKDSYEPVVFTLRLVPNRDYRFVVFADFVAQGATANPTVADQANIGLRHTIGNTLQEITVKENNVANMRLNDEVADAYFAFEDIKITNSQAKDMVLRRPYGKLRVVATDLAELNLNVEPNEVKVTYTAANPNKFNAVTGKIQVDNTPVEYVIHYNSKAGKTSLADYTYTEGYDALTAPSVNGTVRNTHITLFTDYILADAEQKPINFNMEVFDRKGDIIKANTFNTEIPIQRNYLTSVVGNILTTATDIKVTIDDNFTNGNTWNPDQDEHDIAAVSTGLEFLKAYYGARNLLLLQDIVVTAADIAAYNDFVANGGGSIFAATRAAQTEETTTTINLNGFTLSFEDGAKIEVEEGNTVVIEDNSNNQSGKVEAGTDAGFENNGTITIEGGTIGEGAIENNGTANLNGGAYESGAIENNGTANVDEKYADKIDDIVENGANAEGIGIKVSSVDALKAAIKMEGYSVYVYPNPNTEDGSYDVESKLSLAKGVRLIGVGDEQVKINNSWSSNLFANQAKFTDTYMENICADNNLVIDAGIANGNVVFKNCTFGGKNAHQGVHFDSGNGTITFEECRLIGRNMLGSSIEKVTFNKCYFENKRSSLTGADKWTGVNMWGKYEFNECVFGTEAHCNVKCDGVVAAFNDCSFDDERDITTLINYDGQFEAQITFDGKTYTPGGNDNTEEEEDKLGDPDFQAAIGNNKFVTLQEALDNVEDNQTIKLLNRVDLVYYGNYLRLHRAVNFTLDLNGYKIHSYGKGTHSGGPYNGEGMIDINPSKDTDVKPVTITIKDGFLTYDNMQFIKISGNADASTTVNFDNVKISGAVGPSCDHEGIHVVNYGMGTAISIDHGNVTVNLNKGTRISNDREVASSLVNVTHAPLVTVCCGTLNIYEGAEFIYNDVEHGLSLSNKDMVVISSTAGHTNTGVVNVYGGYGRVVGSCFKMNHNGGLINIYGGEWIANTDGTLASKIAESSNCVLNMYGAWGYGFTQQTNIYGGTLRGSLQALGSGGSGSGSELNISGGNFNADPTQYVVDGCTATQNSQGYWVVE